MDRQINNFCSNLYHNFSALQLYEKHCKKKSNFNVTFATAFSLFAIFRTSSPFFT